MKPVSWKTVSRTLTVFTPSCCFVPFQQASDRPSSGLTLLAGRLPALPVRRRKKFRKAVWRTASGNRSLFQTLLNRTDLAANYTSLSKGFCSLRGVWSRLPDTGTPIPPGNAWKPTGTLPGDGLYPIKNPSGAQGKNVPLARTFRDGCVYTVAMPEPGEFFIMVAG